MAFKRLCIIGGSGMLGTDLMKDLTGKGYEVSAPHENEANLLHSVDDLKAIIEPLDPEIIIHIAAVTDVDAAERNPELAHAINKEGTRKIAVIARDLGAIMAYVSTDQVFDGNRNPQSSPAYTPKDKPNPINQYGLSKYYGELMVQELLDTHYILRTSWLYGIQRNNFAQWVLDSAKAGKPINVVSDWVGTPTWSGSLAHAIERTITSGEFGTHHLAGQVNDNSGVSKYEQAVAMCRGAGLPTEGISPIESGKLTFDAPRPAFTPLDCSTSPINMPHWETSFQAYLTQYNDKYQQSQQQGVSS